ncbi:MAG: hypothetical protein ACRD3J_04215, partial [Thermoanaerobaculia bacterium]
GSDALLAFTRTATGNVFPLSEVAGPATGLAAPFGLTLDLAGGLTSNVPAPGVIPALSWKALLALAVMLSVLGLMAMRR